MMQLRVWVSEDGGKISRNFAIQESEEATVFRVVGFRVNLKKQSLPPHQGSNHLCNIECMRWDVAMGFY